MDASELVRRLEDGEGLPVVDGWRRELGDGEVLHAETAAQCWWFGAIKADVGSGFWAFGQRGIFTGTPDDSLVTCLVRRMSAERLAGLQWHYLGEAPVRLTSERVLIGLDGDWLSLWLDELGEVAPDSPASGLWLTPKGTTPLVLQGPPVRYLGVALQALLCRDLPDDEPNRKREQKRQNERQGSIDQHSRERAGLTLFRGRMRTAPIESRVDR